MKSIKEATAKLTHRTKKTDENNDNMSALAGKVALITGGSKGIGAALSERLASLGATVAINYSSDSSAADKLVEKIKKNGHGQATTVKANAASIPEIESMVDQVVKQHGKIDILVPCAGVLPMRTLDKTSEKDFDDTFALNVKGPYFLAQVRLSSRILQLIHADIARRKRCLTSQAAATSSSSPPV